MPARPLAGANKQVLTIEGNIVNINKVFRGRIEIDNETDQRGTINKIGAPYGDADFIFGEELIFPGFVDLHVHARECADHSQEYKEDFKTAGEAAANGGVVAFMEMPNNPTPPIDDKSYEGKNKLAEKSVAEVVLYAGIGPSTEPLSKKLPYKVYMGPSVGSLFFSSSKELEKIIAKYKGCSISFHCEDPEILEENKNEPTHEKRRPASAETLAVDFAISLIKKYDLQGKICHCSTKEGIEKIRAAKASGVNVVAEVSPHHLYYDADALTNENEKWMQMNPPLRSHEDRVALLEALRDGTIDFLATDHAPHTIEEKEKGTSGTPQLDTYGPFITWLMKEENFTPEKIAEISSYNPGKFINQFSKGKYGKIEQGYTGSLTIIDMQNPITITKENLKTKCGWSPFLGKTFPGRVLMTIIKGVVYENK